MAQCKHFDICGLEGGNITAEGYCILHNPTLDKDRTAFDEALKQHQETRGHDYEYMVFIGKISFFKTIFSETASQFTRPSFYKTIFSERADFREAVFRERAFFPKATFSKHADFSGATFLDEAEFGNATFTEGASFGGATFGDVAEFGGTTFSSTTDFRSATFSSWADFSKATFSEMVFFTEATFSTNANFSRATFSGHSEWFNLGPDFTGVTFSGDADFREATFTGHPIFTSTFSSWADFSEATFNGTAEFFRAAFNDWADFTKTTLTNANFSRATFSGNAYFPEATFFGWASFVSATFNGETNFRETTFSSTANFRSSTFRSWADFFRATFSEGADFTRATFSGETHFTQTVFLGPLTLVYATFLGRTSFDGPAPDERADAPQEYIFTGVEVDFTRVRLGPRDAVSFRNADLRKMRLLDTDVRKIEFTSVQWPEKNGNTCLYDETAYDHQLTVDLYKGEAAYNLPRRAKAITRTWEQTVPWGRLERLYRELKQNHEDRKDYSKGGDFHYREKEMQRLRPEARLTSRWWLLTLYKTLGGYGERVGPPLVSCLALLAICAILYVGFELPLFDAALHSLQVSFFQRPDIPATFGKWGHFVQTLQTILSPILLGLLALAIRQRVKR